MRPQPPAWIGLWVFAWTLFCVLLLLAVGTFFAPARAQEGRNSVAMACAKTADVEAGLSGIGERVMAQGVAINNAMMQLWVHPRTHSFTVIIRLPNGSSCMVISGDDLEIGNPS